MNILQITNTVCTDTNQATGVNRVVTQLCDYLYRTHQDNCFLAYFEGEGTATPLFKDSFCFKPSFNPQNFETFLLANQIDIILFNFAANQMLGKLKDVCMIARKHNIKVIYCHHFMPGSEGYSYGSLEEVYYSILTRKNVYEKLKKWIITISRPLSTKFIHRVMKGKYDKAYRECDKIVVFSEPYIDRYLNIVRGNNRNKFAVIPNPLSFPEFLPKESLNKKKKEVIYVGRLQEPQKRVSVILKIWTFIEKNPLLTNWTLSIIGNGKNEPYYRWFAEKHQLRRVSFVGRQDPKPYYRNASIMLSTSTYEGWPMVFMEAMPMGCCCLTFDSYDAVHDIIQNGHNGWIIPNNNIKEYTQCLTELMLDKQKQISMGIAAIESSKRFSMEIIGEKWRELLIVMSKYNQC